MTIIEKGEDGNNLKEGNVKPVVVVEVINKNYHERKLTYYKTIRQEIWKVKMSTPEGKKNANKWNVHTKSGLLLKKKEEFKKLQNPN